MNEQKARPDGVTARDEARRNDPIDILNAIDRKLLWLSSWMVHNANHLRESRDGVKVGGHQASCASVTTLMTALYMSLLRPEDRVAVKPHASPVFHAIQYLFGHADVERLKRFRGFGGAQAYPSRTKDADDVDFSTGSVGLGVALALFSSLVQDYVFTKGLVPSDRAPGRMIAVVGDAEMDEGNIYEALLEGWKQDLRNVWWIIDYNRQSLDSVVSDRLFSRIDKLFHAMNWRVVTLKYGKKLERAFAGPDGEHLRQWIDDCPNSLYSALTYKGGPGWRARLEADLGRYAGIRKLLAGHDDAELHALMTNLAGHDMETVLEAFHAIDDDKLTCFICYTIKGYGLPFAGHKDNHAGLMNETQMDGFQETMGIREGHEWDIHEGLEQPGEAVDAFLRNVNFASRFPRRHEAPKVDIPDAMPLEIAKRMSTQDAFGRILNELGREDSEFARRVVTTSPDVTVSTNLGPWVNRRGIFSLEEREDVFQVEKVVSAHDWSMSRHGQHVELGIAENNLFLLLAAMGLSHELFGARLLPIGTLYDPFIARGLDSFNYACYQDARFMLVGTPSGITLAPEGGAHQSVYTPAIGMGMPGLVSFEPAFADELAVMMAWGFRHMQADDGGSVYLRLSTRPVDQPAREMDDDLRQQVLDGGYWLVPPEPDAEIAIVYSGVVAPEVLAAHQAILDDIPGAGILAVTSADRLYQDWQAAQMARREEGVENRSHVERLLGGLSPKAALVTVLDGHPAVMSWLGAVAGHRHYPLGVDQFGQSGDVPDLYRASRIDTDAILDACASACLG